MKPWKTLGRALAPGGGELVLQERDGVYVIRAGGHELMSSLRHGSEEAMAQAAGLQGRSSAAPQVLVGGLGLGYTLRAALDLLPPGAKVVVAELFEAVVDWNRGPLAPLAGRPLEDPRVVVERADVADVVAGGRARFDAILLDVDNGPEALTQQRNVRLYGAAGLAAFRAALRPGGVLVVWSAGPAPRFVEQLRQAGFAVREERVAARPTAGARHTLFVARREDPVRRP